jgi:O-acetylhomoserine (thiol)-lyase
MSAPKYPHLDTLAVHAGQSPDPTTGARAVPIYQSASFVFPDTDTAASLFNLERAGHVYSRISNPTLSVFEERMAALDGAPAAIAVASGQAALHLGIATLMGAGAHIVASNALYGGSHNLLSYTLPRFGIETTFVDGRNADAWRAAIRPNTRLLFGETVGNPGLDVLNVPMVAEIAHAAGIPLMVDATLTTPYLSRPISQGADIVMHSATKFLSGHGVVIGGVLLDGGTFDWEASGKFPTLTEPYEGFHGMIMSQESSVAAFALRARREGLRDFGAAMAPMTAFQILQGLETLHVRMPKHVENTRKVVQFLSSNKAVAKVTYPELESHPDHQIAKQLLPNGAGAVVSFDLKGEDGLAKTAGKTFIEKLSLFSHLANIGDAKSLVIHPATTTHFRMDAAALKAAGISEGTIRLSIGIEHADDLIEDLSKALYAAGKVAGV